jgi:hypothetical protein
MRRKAILELYLYPKYEVAKMYTSAQKKRRPYARKIESGLNIVKHLTIHMHRSNRILRYA